LTCSSASFHPIRGTGRGRFRTDNRHTQSSTKRLARSNERSGTNFTNLLNELIVSSPKRRTYMYIMVLPPRVMGNAKVLPLTGMLHLLPPISFLRRSRRSNCLSTSFFDRSCTAAKIHSHFFARIPFRPPEFEDSLAVVALLKALYSKESNYLVARFLPAVQLAHL
jgi:hypothetical protein